ncbi:MAG: TonB family protein [Gemmatimonadetes bacterium]|nr:TonB family protein [Gemmatimonadota bacterium]
MFDQLIVSNPQGNAFKKGLPSTVMSTVIHGLLIWGAVNATMTADVNEEEVVGDTTMIFLTEEEPEPEPEEEPPPQQQVLTLDPPPKGFQTLDAPIDIPTEIPPIDLTERFDPRDFSGVGVEGGVFSGVQGGTGPVDFSQTFNEAAVDERPERISGPMARYPEMLRQAGIEGVVLLEFVIDTSGHVERETIKILSSTNRAFEGPAREVVRRSLFRPGRVRGQAVRVLVQQQIGFTIQTGDDDR